MLSLFDANQGGVLLALRAKGVEQQQPLNAGLEDRQALRVKLELPQLVVYVNRVEQQQAGHAGSAVQRRAHVERGGHRLTNSRFFLEPTRIA